MKRTWIRGLCLIAAVMMIISGTALAETYAKLRNGNEGEDVRRLQSALKQMGLFSTTVDGKYGTNTENAVRAFQKKYHLYVDGIAGEKTLAKLYALVGDTADTAPAAAAPAAAASASPGSSAGSGYFGGDYSSILPGEKGYRVQLLQAALNKLGYSCGEVDGSYGRATRKAVQAFQRANKIGVNGKAMKKTLQKIEQLLGNDLPVVAKTTSAQTTAASGTAGTAAAAVTQAQPGRTLRSGDRGDDVKSLQSRLASLGYYTGNLDGIYGDSTAAAVKSFQIRCSLKTDGVAGPKTYAKLYASTAPAVTATSTQVGTIVPVNSTGLNNASSSCLTVGSSGNDVKRLQTSLSALGYAVNITGTYDSVTADAVRAFQSRNSLYVDGIAGADTQTVLYSGNCAAASGAVSAGGAATTTVTGPSASQVKLLHWFNDVKPSLRSGQNIYVYDPATGYGWNLRLLSLGRHADAEPLTKEDTAAMVAAFGGKTWTQRAVYVRLPNGVWTVASTHDMPHLTGHIKDNNFDGHLCVHFLRDMDECKKNDPKYGVSNQNTIRQQWKSMTGIDVP